MNSLCKSSTTVDKV